MYRIQPSNGSKFFSVACRRSVPPMPTRANIVSLVQKCFLNPTPAQGCYNAWMPISPQCVGRRRTPPRDGSATASDSVGFLRWVDGCCCFQLRLRRPRRPAPLRLQVATVRSRTRQRSLPSITLSTIVIMRNRKRLPWLPRPSLRRHFGLRNSRPTRRPSISTMVF